MSELKKIFDDKFVSIDDMEELIAALRSAGASRPYTVWLITTRTSLPLDEADAIVLNSETWRTERQQIIDFREKFWDMWESLPDEM